jgi:hypothetical protein
LEIYSHGIIKEKVTKFVIQWRQKVATLSQFRQGQFTYRSADIAVC